MSLVRNDDGPGIFDDAVLDEFNIPFGSWIEEAVNWITLNMGGVLTSLRGHLSSCSKSGRPFFDRNSVVVVVAIMFVIAWLVET